MSDPAFAKDIVTGFSARIESATVGFVVKQPMALAGVLDAYASRKAAGGAIDGTSFGVVPSSLT